MTAEQERGAVVAWLREEQRQNSIVDIGGAEEVSAKRFANACKVIADAIERGDHTRDKEGQGHE